MSKTSFLLILKVRDETDYLPTEREQPPSAQPFFFAAMIVFFCPVFPTPLFSSWICIGNGTLD